MSRSPSSGLRGWLIQRFSAVYIAVFSLVLIGAWFDQPATYYVWRNWVASPLVNIMVIVFFLAILFHAWVGIRDIVMDYIKPDYMRYLLLTVFGLALMSMGFWVLRILILVTPV